MDILTLWHFTIYFSLAYFIKDNYLLITIIGLTWELFEYSVTNIPIIRDFLIDIWPLKNKWMKDNQGINVPWKTEQVCDRIEDMVSNTLGYTCGLLFFT